MNELLRFGEKLFDWVLQTSWQAAVLAVVIVFIQAMFRRQLSPSWRYGLWLLLLVRLVLPASPQTSWSIYNLLTPPGALNGGGASSGLELADRPVFLPAIVTPARTEAHLSDAPAKSAEPPVVVPKSPQQEPSMSQRGLSLSWRQFAFFAWVLGASLFAARFVWSNLRFAREINGGSIITDKPTLLLLESCREALGVSRPVTLIETEAVRSPAVHGLWRKRLFLPRATLEHFSTEELRCIFLHELAHIKRRDLEVNWVASVLLVVHWFNPLLWFAFAKMRQDREIACDSLVLTNLGPTFAQPYGETIIKVVGNLLHSSRPPGVLALSEDRQRLKERIRMIAGFRRWPRWSALALTLAIGIAAVGLTNASRGRTATEPNPNSATAETSPEQSTVVLPRGIHGRVVDFQGNPVTNAQVQCQEFDWQATTDAQGRFSWKGEEQPRTFHIRKTGFKSLVTGLLSPSETETILRLRRAPVIAGKVIDQGTGQPVPEFQVYHVRLTQGPVIPSLSPHEVVSGKLGAFQYAFARFFWPDSAFYIEAEGYRPVLSRPLISGDDGKELTFELVRVPSLRGKVLTPQGTPAGKAEIRLWCGELNLPDIASRHLIESDENGAFAVPTILDGKVLVFHNSGYAETPWQEFVTKGIVQLVEWGHVKGTWPHPLPKNRKVSIERINWAGRMNQYTFPPPWRVSDAQINADGSFSFEEGAPPGEYVLTEWNNLKLEWPGGGYSMGMLSSKRLSLRVEPGGTTVVEVPAGRSVKGQVSSDGQSLTNVHLPIVRLSLKQNGPELPFPRLDPSLSEGENLQRWTDYREQVLKHWLSEEGKALRRAERVFEVPAETDGTFQIDNVPPGTYELQVNAQMWGGKTGPEIRREVSIPPSTDGTPVDLGILKESAPIDLGVVEQADHETQHYALSGGRDCQVRLNALQGGQVLVEVVVLHTNSQGNTRILARPRTETRPGEKVTLDIGDDRLSLTPKVKD